VLSVIIVNWNTKDMLLACLASLRNHPPREPLEIFVVDNASSDGSADAVQASFPEAMVIALTRNAGYAEGNNAAFRQASGELILTLNPDTEVLQGSLDRATEIMVARPEIGALAARLIGADGRVQRSVRGFPSLLGILGDLSGLARLFPRSAWGSYRLPSFDYETAQPAPQPMGTFLLYRRAALEAVGDPCVPFDERFPIFFNEVDLLYRMSLAGWPCWYSPEVSVIHHGGASTRQVRRAMIWESHRSLLRYFRKHHRTAWNTALFPVFGAIVLLAAFVRARGWSRGFGA
jgi:hypothetical protein